MIPLLDTHQHLLLSDRLTYAWADRHTALADRAFTLDDYLALTEGRGISASLFMEADADDYVREARVVSALARQPGSPIRGVIAACRPEEPAAFDAWLEEIADLPVVGLRRILHEVDDAVSQAETFRANLRRLAPRGLTFDIVMRWDQLPLAGALQVDWVRPTLGGGS